MSRNTEPDEICQITQGVLLLLAWHIIMGALILHLASIVNLGWVFFGLLGVLQLLYVIPLSLWLKRQGKVGMMKGVIIGAVITALLHGACFLAISR